MPQTLLQAVRDRVPSSDYGYGITTADKYVGTLQKCVGSDLCYRYGSTRSTSFQDVLTKAASTLVYSNEDMVVRDQYHEKSKFLKALPDVELPPNTLMVFTHVLTTPRKDRDGDILRTKGAQPDPKMLLLWQHVHTLPIGKALGVVKHTEEELVMCSAVVDINELAHDSAVMIANGMGRFSHGFKALEFNAMKVDGGKPTAKPSGFDVKRFEIMEESLVSVPANVEADTLEIMLDLIESDKLTSSMMKSYAKDLRKMRPRIFGGFNNDETDESTDGTKDCGCGCGGSGACGRKPKKKPASEETDADAGKGKSDADTGAEDDKVKDGMCPKCKVKLQNGVCQECGYGQTETEKSEEPEDTDKSTEASMFYMPMEEMKAFEAELIKLNLVKAGDGLQLVGLLDSSAIVKSTDGTLFDLEWFDNGEAIEIKSIEAIVPSEDDDDYFEGTKAGRVLSKSNLSKLKDVQEDLKEIGTHCSTRSGKALCGKCSGTLKSVIDSAESGDSDEPKHVAEELTTKQHAAKWLENATQGERSNMLKALQAMAQIDEQERTTAEFRKSIGSYTEKTN